MNQKIKIYSDKKYLHPGERHEIIFYPFWGSNSEDPNDPVTGRFNSYAAVGKNIFEMSSLDECDLAVLPYQWRGMDSPTQDFIEQARKAGKPILIFFNHDSTEDIPVRDGLIFRTSFYQSTRKPNEFAMPGWCEDFVERYFDGALPVRAKEKKPVVSYCGYAANWKFRIKQLLKFSDLHPGMLIRTYALDILKASRHVRTNFIIRSGFWGNVYKENGGFDPVEMKRVRREYVENMVGGDYVLCTRGGGNFSYRLYEILSVGRIPVLVDTDCVLPYDKFITWRDICVWVDEKNLKQIDKKVAEFHAKLSDAEFRELQKKCRQIWEEWISPVGFFKNLYRYIK